MDLCEIQLYVGQRLDRPGLAACGVEGLACNMQALLFRALDLVIGEDDTIRRMRGDLDKPDYLLWQKSSGMVTQSGHFQWMCRVGPTFRFN